MAQPPKRRRSGESKGRKPARKTSGSWPRTAVAILLVLGLVAVVVYLGSRPERHGGRAGEDPLSIVREAAVRYGCPAERVHGEADEIGGPLRLLRVAAPATFPVDRFSLDLEARLQGRGGKLTPEGHKSGAPWFFAGTLGDVLFRVEVVVESPQAALHGRPTAPKPTAEPTPTRMSQPEVGSPTAAAVPPPASTPPRAPGPPRLAIVLDDGGNSLEPLTELARLPRAVAVAVLPNTPLATEFARGAAAQGREVLLHAPMDKLASSSGPGPGYDAIGTGLGDREIEARLGRALLIVPEARGVNNHMGSEATADRRVMTVVMRVLAGRGLYFLDSRTTPATVAEEVAREHGVPALRRDVFLDNSDAPAAIRAALGEAVTRAAAQGDAVAIGHVHPTTLAVLASELPRALGSVRLVPPSDLLRP